MPMHSLTTHYKTCGFCVCKPGYAGTGECCGPDQDVDGWPDVALSCGNVIIQADNCPTIPNSGQEDSDNDGQGDNCDDDADNDGVPNSVDNCEFVFNPDQTDGDG